MRSDGKSRDYVWQDVIDGKVDTTLPVVPPLEIIFAIPIPVASTAWNPVPCTTPANFFQKLIDAEVGARRVGATFPRDSRVAGEAGDQVGDLHSAINVAGRVLHALAFYTQECTKDPGVRLLANTIENAWLAYNFHAWYVTPGIERETVLALEEKVGAIIGEIGRLLPGSEPVFPEGTPLFESSGFSEIFRTTISGKRVRVKESTITFAGTLGDLTVVPFQGGCSPKHAAEMLGGTVTRLAREVVSLLNASSVNELVPQAHVAAYDAIRRKFLPMPVTYPRVHVAVHFLLHSRHARSVILEASDAVVFAKTLQPGEVARVSMRSWERDAATGEQGAAYADTPLPEARDALVEDVRQRLGTLGQSLGRFVVEISPGQVAAIPGILRDALVAQTRAANAQRAFVVAELPATAIIRGRVHKFFTPTEFGANIFEFRNASAAPLRVEYVTAKQTYHVTVSFAKATVTYWNGASGEEIGSELPSNALGTVFRPEARDEASRVLAMLQQAEEAGKACETGVVPVGLHKPVAAPRDFFEQCAQEISEQEIDMSRVNDP